MVKSRPYIFDLTQEELSEIVCLLGEKKFRASQIWQNLYRNLHSSFDEMSNISYSFRRILNSQISFSRLHPKIDILSSDGNTRKILFNIPSRKSFEMNQIETVLMKYRNRNTACISTQAGCALGCTFCATGQGGFQRNISSGEIIEQVLFFERMLRKENMQLTNLVFMGMGEPFANYDEVMKAVEKLTDPQGFNFGARRITISTVGIVPMIERFADEKRQVNLAISLHAATDDLRNTLLPINKRYPLESLIQACKNYTLKTRRRISFEWALIRNVNDTPEQANQLVKILRGMLCHVNFIPLNPTKGYSGIESHAGRIQKFQKILSKAGIPNTLRVRRGIDINAGCGQLRQVILSDDA